MWKIQSARTELHALQRQVKALQEKAIDTKNWLHHNNLKVLGLPEQTDSTNTAAFVET